MKKLITICSAALLSSVAMANYVMYVNNGTEVMEEFDCSSVDSLKLVDTNISVFADPRKVPFAIQENLSLTFEEPSLSDTVKITYRNGAGVSVHNPYPESVLISSDGEHVSVNCINEELKDVVYLLSGSSDNGSFMIESLRKFTVVLNNLKLTSTTVNSPIRSYSGKTMTVVLPTGTVSQLTDSANDTCNAVIRSKGQIVFSENGDGQLTVTAAAKRAIQTGDYIVVNGGNVTAVSSLGDAVKANDYFEMNAGKLTIPAGGIEVSAGYAVINGGSLSLTSDQKDDKMFKVVQSPDTVGYDQNGTLTINGGSIELNVNGQGSKGIKVSRDIIMNGGSLSAQISGTYFYDGDYNVSSLGKADREFNVKGGEISINILPDALGGRGFSADSLISITGDAKVTINNHAKNYLTSKDKVKVGCGLKCDSIIVFGGNSMTEIVADAAQNSAINIVSNRDVTVNDNAKLYIESASNATLDGDGSYLTLNGGVTLSFAGSGFSAAQFKPQSKGGVFVGVGSKAILTYKSDYCLVQDASFKLGDAVNVKGEDGTSLFTFQSPSKFANSAATSAFLLFSMPTLQKDASYTYSVGGTISGGTSFHGYNEGGNYQAGTDYSFKGIAGASSVPVSIVK